MSIYEKLNFARALLYWAKSNNGNEVRYLEDRMYAVADGDMVILLTADSYDEAIRKAKARHTHAKGECRTCTHRDPEDKKCDCGGQERQGCQFPVSDDYYCKYYEKGGAE